MLPGGPLVCHQRFPAAATGADERHGGRGFGDFLLEGVKLTAIKPLVYDALNPSWCGCAGEGIFDPGFPLGFVRQLARQSGPRDVGTDQAGLYRGDEPLVVIAERFPAGPGADEPGRDDGVEHVADTRQRQLSRRDLGRALEPEGVSQPPQALLEVCVTHQQLELSPGAVN